MEIYKKIKVSDILDCISKVMSKPIGYKIEFAQGCYDSQYYACELDDIFTSRMIEPHDWHEIVKISDSEILMHYCGGISCHAIVADKYSYKGIEVEDIIRYFNNEISFLCDENTPLYMDITNERYEVGDFVFTSDTKKWGWVKEIGKDNVIVCNNANLIDDAETWYTTDIHVYVPCTNYAFCGHPICFEHNEERDYEFYCPFRDENFITEELDIVPTDFVLASDGCDVYFETNVKAYKWVKTIGCDDSTEDSDKVFKTRSECYHDMREHAFKYINHYTDYDTIEEDDTDITPDTFVEIGVNRITIKKAYTDTYEIKEIKVTETL